MTDKTDNKKALHPAFTNGMKRLKKSTAFHGSTRIAPPGPGSASRCAVTGTPGRGSPLHSAVVEVRHMAGCLQHPCGAALSAAWSAGPRFVRINDFKQDETTLIVARPTQKIKGHRCEISASAVIPRRELRHREPGGRNAKAHGDAAELTPRPAARQSPLRRCGS